MIVTKRQMRMIIKEEIASSHLQQPDFEELGQDIGAFRAREKSRILDLMNDVVLALTELGDYRHLTQTEQVMLSMEDEYGV